MEQAGAGLDREETIEGFLIVEPQIAAEGHTELGLDRPSPGRHRTMFPVVEQPRDFLQGLARYFVPAEPHG